MEICCDNCFFWYHNSDKGELCGECRIRAPIANPDNVNNFPITYAYAWCGEFEKDKK